MFTADNDYIVKIRRQLHQYPDRSKIDGQMHAHTAVLLGAAKCLKTMEKVPGTMFRLGTRNMEKGFNAITHNNNFGIDLQEA